MKLEVLTKLATCICYRCGNLFYLDEMQWDHVRALVDGGEHHPSNLRPVCVGCHREKSAFEHIRNSKSKRLAKARDELKAVLSGEKQKQPGTIKSRPFGGWRKFDGSIVRK